MNGWLASSPGLGVLLSYVSRCGSEQFTSVDVLRAWRIVNDGSLQPLWMLDTEDAINHFLGDPFIFGGRDDTIPVFLGPCSPRTVHHAWSNHYLRVMNVLDPSWEGLRLYMPCSSDDEITINSVAASADLIAAFCSYRYKYDAAYIAVCRAGADGAFQAPFVLYTFLFEPGSINPREKICLRGVLSSNPLVLALSFSCKEEHGAPHTVEAVTFCEQSGAMLSRVPIISGAICNRRGCVLRMDEQVLVSAELPLFFDLHNAGCIQELRINDHSGQVISTSSWASLLVPCISDGWVFGKSVIGVVWIPGVGYVALLGFWTYGEQLAKARIVLLQSTDLKAMAAMSLLRCAWMGAVIRGMK